jgi:hypothetical protein
LFEEGARTGTILNNAAVTCRNNYGRLLNRLGKRDEAHELLVTLLAEVKAAESEDLRSWAVPKVSGSLAWVESGAAEPPGH